MAIGDPHTRPDEETVFVSESFDLARDARDWADCALVPWAMHLPQGCGARDIAALITRRLQLQATAVTVTLNQPEPYLVRFEKATEAARARDLGRFTGGGIDICLRPWRGLTHAMGFRMFYRVRLFLDGIPDHAWTPAIVERVIGHRCALQYIVTDLVQPADTRHIELWAWTPDPRDIPKKVWLAFTHGPAGGSSAVYIDNEPPPAAWYQGNRYAVFIHLSILEDYKAVEENLQGAIDNPASVKPIRRRYDWRYGLPDGAPPEARSHFPTRLPKPPRELGGRGGRDDDGDRATEHRRNTERERELRERALQRRERELQRERDERARQRERDLERERERSKTRAGRHSCNDKAFDWPSRRDDDDDEDNGDYDHPGHGRHLDSSFWGAGEPFPRDRTRSPPRRAFGAGRVWHHANPDQPVALAVQLLGADNQATLNANQLRNLFTAQAASLQRLRQQQVNDHPVLLSPTSDLHRAELSFISKAARLADKLGLEAEATGERAWPDPVPTLAVFNRLRAQLHVTFPMQVDEAPSFREVEQALDAWALDAGAQDTLPAKDAGAAPPSAVPPEDMALGNNGGSGIRNNVADTLFTNLDPPLLQQPAARRGRQRRVFGMKSVRRSARLANRPAIPAVERAQRVLCRKLGIQEDKHPIDEVLREFISMFQGPLPEHIIAALSALFDLEDDATVQLDNALLQHAGVAVADLDIAEEVA
jgi:hypothetical protein